MPEPDPPPPPPPPPPGLAPPAGPGVPPGSDAATLADWLRNWARDVDQQAQPLSLLEIAGIGVFLMSALFGMLTLLVGAVSGNLYANEPWVWLRTGENLFRIGAIGILVAFIARSVNAYVTIFGVLVIGALIIPTKDIMGFAAIFTDRDRDMAKFFADEASLAEFQGADRQLARDILATLGSTGGEVDFALAGAIELGGLRQAIDELNTGQRRQAEDLILRAANLYKVQTIAERARLRGADHVLLALYRNDFASYLFRARDRDKLEEDLVALRRDGAVIFLDAAFETARPTILGCETAVHLGSTSGQLRVVRTEDAEEIPGWGSYVGVAFPVESFERAKDLEVEASEPRSWIEPICAERRDTIWSGLGATSSIGTTSVQSQILAQCDRLPEIATRVPVGEAHELQYSGSPHFMQLDFPGGGGGMAAAGSEPLRVTVTGMEDPVTLRAPDPVLWIVRRGETEGRCEIIRYNDDMAGNNYNAQTDFTPLPDNRYFLAIDEFSRLAGRMRVETERVRPGMAAEAAGADAPAGVAAEPGAEAAAAPVPALAP